MKLIKLPEILIDRYKVVHGDQTCTQKVFAMETISLL